MERFGEVAWWLDDSVGVVFDEFFFLIFHLWFELVWTWERWALHVWVSSYWVLFLWIIPEGRGLALGSEWIVCPTWAIERCSYELRRITSGQDIGAQYFNVGCLISGLSREVLLHGWVLQVATLDRLGACSHSQIWVWSTDLISVLENSLSSLQVKVVT